MHLANETLSYIAGFFDGEGYIGIVPAYRRYIMQVAIGQCDPRPLNFISSCFGGSVMLVTSPSKMRRKRKPIYRWSAASNKALYFLQSIRPWLIVKAEQADLAIDFQSKVVRKKLNRVERGKIILLHKEVSDNLKLLKMKVG